tara:strand:+ start:598 stop:786 length:189 start_codon:yes stop_codon:yes gene_type:complete
MVNENYHKSYYERNKDYLRAYQRAYYYRKKNEIKKKKSKPVPRKKKDLTMHRYYGTFTIHFD